ncbi:unnamed protein product [Adineta steineri]|uniref:G-protein coupled receptors family 1 profile domain-containing protein n=1 Tax=Adineta steineri TaxID=433720 RepID=A0A814QX61_9BILA|nr:unnamed protein product [Adineta steineri]CAF1123955.1 unnamed protein product [Adineta steineri]
MVSWVYATKIFVQYAGTFLFFFNFCGGIMTIIVLSTDSTYRRKPCTYFMLISAIAGCIQLLDATLARVLSTGFNIDLTRTSSVLCKLRQYSYGGAPGIAITCDWLSVIGQYLVTSRSARLRQLSTMKLAYHVSFGVIVFWALQSIPFLIFTSIRSGTCMVTNLTLQAYFTYGYFFTFATTIPIIMQITFGTLTYRNMRMLQNSHQLQGADRQLTLMVCAQIGLILTTSVPYAIYYAYSLNTAYQNKTTEQKDKENFVGNVLGLTATFEFGGSFYLFVAVSKRFRQQVKRCICLFRKRRNIVVPRTEAIQTISANPATKQ